MRLRTRLDTLEALMPSPAQLVICSHPEEATFKRRNLPPEAVVIVTGVPRITKEAKP